MVRVLAVADEVCDPLWGARAATLAPDDYGISMHYSTADLLERHGHLTEAAQEWRFIIDWSEQHGDPIAADWPKRELQRLQTYLAGA